MTVSLQVMCTSSYNETRSISSFEREVNIKGDPLSEITIFSNKNVNMLAMDTFLVIQQNHDNVLSVYSTNDNKLLKEYGTIGSGNLEFTDPVLLKQRSYDKVDGSPEILIYDYTRRVINSINLLDMLNEEEGFHTQSPLDEEELYYLHFYYDSPDFHLGVPEGMSKFTLFDKSNSMLSNVPYSPKLDFEVEQSLLYPIYRSAIAVNEKKKKIATATLLIPTLEIYNFQLDLLNDLNFENTLALESSLIEYAKTGLFDSKHYIVELDSDDEYILGLNYNNASTDIYSDYSYTDLNFLLFDWEANLLTKFVLSDNKFVESFAVDFGSNKVYCYLPLEKDHNIYVYDLNP